MIVSSITYSISYFITDGAIYYRIHIVDSSWGVPSLKYKNEKNEKEKRKRALFVLIACWEKTNIVTGWNERIHKLGEKLKGHEKYLSDDSRQMTENTEYYIDTNELELKRTMNFNRHNQRCLL
jgi:hypothetical protein